MKHLNLLVLSLVSFSMACFGQEATGDTREGLWLGIMKVSEEMSLQLGFEIVLAEDGVYAAKMNVIEQKALGIPMDTCIIRGDSLYIEFKVAGIVYLGAYSSEKDMILGTYSQGGGSYTLDMARMDKLPLEIKRPQMPVRPFPYDELEVEFENSEAGITLAGTLTKPQMENNLPAVVLIAGTGKNDRDETSMGHFLLLSDFLTRNGFAVLRYDKRGVGASGGDYGQATTFDFAEDARAALDYLRAQPNVDPGRTGLIGHSEGALIAPIIASEYVKEVAFIVMMGGIGIPGTDLLLTQYEKLARINGTPEEEIAKIRETNRRLYAIASSGLEDSLMVIRCREAVPELDEEMLNMLKWIWFKSFLSLDPDSYMSKVSCPVLAITGEKDVQCPPEENLAAIEASLMRAGNDNYMIKVMPGLNHLFQTAKSGSPYEYEQIEEIISPDALDFILDWLQGVNP